MKKILVLVDFTDVTDLLIDYSTKLGAALSAKIWLLHIAHPEPDFVGYDAGPDVVRGQVAHEFREEHRLIQAMAEQIRSDNIEASALLIQGATIEKIMEQTERLGIDLIIAGSHHHNKFYRKFMGNIADELLDKITCPILLVPEQKTPE